MSLLKWFKWTTALSMAVISGVVIYKKLEKDLLTPQQALSAVKRTTKDKYPIDGSWIHMTPDTVTRFRIPYTVYHGGLTSTHNDEINHYDFIVDATTGTLLELKPNE